MGLTIDSSQMTFLSSSKSRDTKTMTNITNLGRSNLDIVSLFNNQWSVASSHCGGGDSFLKWKDFQLSRPRDLDLGSGHTACCRASLIDRYLHAKFHWNHTNSRKRHKTITFVTLDMLLQHSITACMVVQALV